MKLDEALTSMYPTISPTKINIYKDIAEQKLVNYFENQLFRSITIEELETKYTGALFLLISSGIEFEDTKGLKSIKQGNKQKAFNTYDNKQFVLSKEILDMLPMPLAKPVTKEEVEAEANE